MPKRKDNKWPQGHEMTPENSKPHNGYVNCRICSNLGSKIHHRLKRARDKAKKLGLKGPPELGSLEKFLERRKQEWRPEA